MAIKGSIFPNQIPTAAQLGATFKPLYEDGVLHGCNVTYSGSNAVIAAGMIIACGRVFEITSPAYVACSGSGFARVIINIDTSKASTASEFNQVFFTTQTAATEAAFPALTKGDVNDSGTLYQCELARFAISSGNITRRVSQLGPVGISAGFCKFLTADYYGDNLPAAGNKGRIYFKRLT